jgi:hypothetical protein
MELTRTDAVFSRTAMVLFFVQKIKILGMSSNSTEYLRKNKEKSSQNMKTKGAHTLLRRVGRPPGRVPLPRGPPGAPPTSTPTPYIHVQGEKIREKDSSRFTIWSRRQALISPGRADLESVRGSREGDSSASSSSTILHHQFHDAHRRA